jgi:transposase InsO family protein
VWSCAPALGEGPSTVLVELGVVEQRYQAVLEVLNDGATVTDVARRYGVARQTVHTWLRRYADHGLGGLADRSERPGSCPHQMAPELEARIVAMRRANPGWGPRTIVFRLRAEGVDPVPGRSSVYRALVRHRLLEPSPRRRRRSDYKRWERSRAMELWQMDVVGRIYLADGTELSAVTGIDDHSRFCVIAKLVRRATARPVCDALLEGLARHGVPDQILTDNGKVFTGRFGKGAGPVRFDRICTENGIRHLLTAPYSPTTTGKVERLHKTMRREHFNGERFATIDDAQAALDVWVDTYNRDRPHQSVGDRPPIERFRLARPTAVEPVDVDATTPAASTARRRVAANGRVSFACASYMAGRWLAGEDVTVSCDAGLVQLHHRGVLVATHARRHDPDKQNAGLRRGTRPEPSMRPTASAVSVTRKVDSSGSVSFAGTNYKAGKRLSRRQVQVAVVGETVEISIGTELIRTHPIRHDRTREHGALANPGGRPRRTNAA